MNEPAWNHQHVDANGIGIHYVRHGEGFPLVLLHGWPEFWYTWRKNIPVLAESFDVVAPDLRGFGDTDKPDDHPGGLLGNFVEDLRALADTLGFERFGVVSHDVGAYVAQGFARKYPKRLGGLFFFDCPYPGIGRRWADADSINEIWYQTFNQQPWAASLVGENRKTCETYIRHFLDHWAHAPGLFDEDLDTWVDNFMKPGNLQGGFNWYMGNRAARRLVWKGEVPDLPPIDVPTRVFWGERDPVLKVEWMDRLSATFSNLHASVAEGLGHFVHYEAPQRAAHEIAAFFEACSPRPIP